MPITHNIISYSLWGFGHDGKYLIGALENVKICKEIYPGYKCVFYCDNLVPTPIIYQLRDLGASVVFMNEFGTARNGMFWRLNSVNDADVVLVRDCDSRPDDREKSCVDAWLSSNKGIMTIFDHNFHFPYVVMPGLMGFKKNIIPNMKQLVSDFPKTFDYGVDYAFYAHHKDLILPHLLSFGKDLPVPLPRRSLRFVGEVFNADGTNVLEHTLALKKYLDSIGETH